MTSIELYGTKDTLSAENEKYANALKAVSTTFKEAMEFFNDPKFNSKEDWKKEAENTGSKVFSKQTDRGKVFVLTGELPGKWEDVLKSQWTEVNEMPTWNDNVVFAKIVHSLTANVDIVHYANADIMIVKGRDYVVTRIKRKINGMGYLVARSIDLSEFPETKAHVRGEILMGAGRLSSNPANPNTTLIDYVMCIDLKGMIPKSIVNNAMAKLMQKDFEQTKAHLQKRMN